MGAGFLFYFLTKPSKAKVEFRNSHPGSLSETESKTKVELSDIGFIYVSSFFNI